MKPKFSYIGIANTRGSTMLTRTKTDVRIPRKEWEKMKKNPAFSEAIELLEDIADLEAAKHVRGRDTTLNQYLKKRGLRNNH
jgi:hypothetical protein